MKDWPFSVYDFFGYLASGLVLLMLSQVTLGFPKVFGADLKAFDIAAAVLAVYIAGQIISAPAKALFEDVIIGKVLGSPTRNLLREKPPIGKFFFPNFYKRLPPATRVKVLQKLESLQLHNQSSEDIFLAIRYDPGIVTDGQLMTRLDSFRDRYGFNRNVSFALLVAGVDFLITAKYRGAKPFVSYGIVSALAGAMLFYRYLKFYRQYSFELINTYAVLRRKVTPDV